MAKATIVAASKKFTVQEGSYAVSTFNFVENDGTSVQALDNLATVQVRLTGIGATKSTSSTMKDYTGFYYRTGVKTSSADISAEQSTASIAPLSTAVGSPAAPSGWTAVNDNGRVELPKGSTWIQLISMVNKDDIGAEQNESLVFSLAQTNIGSTAKTLENSYYVTSTANIKESIAVLSKITVDKADAVEEGNDAVAIFKLSSALQGDKAKVAVKVEGLGATLGEDTSGVLKAETSPDGTTWSTQTIKNGQIEVPVGTTKIKLSIATEKDNTTEPDAEKLNFSVRQIKGNLKDSYYVNAEVDLNDPSIGTITNGDTAQTSTGTSGQDIFDMINANSAPFVAWQGNAAGFNDANGADLITNFGTGDVIKLQDSVQRYSIGTVSFEDFTGAAPSNDQTANGLALVKELHENRYDTDFPNGTGSILKIVESNEIVWLLIDTNANGKMDTRLDTDDGGDSKAGGLDNQYDTLIKVVGSTTNTDNLADMITGESFITE